jgi:anion-transporting  ArsA/GET3 family ATPase
MNPLAKALSDANVIVTVGAGGVGKTTLAAALALEASLMGKESLVCTIDPAKRLANSLGIEALGNTETRIPENIFSNAGLRMKAPMWAMMLDMKRSWDSLIETHAPVEAREKILKNKFYQSLSTALAGSQEYVAMEKLYELRTKNRAPLIVLDTPPATHAVDFLNAPGRILNFLDNDAAKFFLTPALKASKIGLGIFSFGSNQIAKTISKFTGTQTLQELAEFMVNISGMYEGFTQRAKDTRVLLESKKTAFVLVTTANEERLSETLALLRTLKQHRLHVAVVVVNRVHQRVDPVALQNAPAHLLAALTLTLEENNLAAESDARGVRALKGECGNVPLLTLPRFDDDVHDLKKLHETAAHLLKSMPL